MKLKSGSDLIFNLYVDFSMHEGKQEKTESRVSWDARLGDLWGSCKNSPGSTNEELHFHWTQNNNMWCIVQALALMPHQVKTHLASPD